MTRPIAMLLAAAVLAVVPSLAWTLERVDINSASIEELQKLPGIGLGQGSGHRGRTGPQSLRYCR